MLSRLPGRGLAQVDPHHVGQAGARDRDEAAVAGGEGVVDVLVVALPHALLDREVEGEPVGAGADVAAAPASRSGTMLMRVSFSCVRASTMVAVPSQLLPTTITVRLPVGAAGTLGRRPRRLAGSAGAAGAAARMPAEATAVDGERGQHGGGSTHGVCLLAARTPGPASVVVPRLIQRGPGSACPSNRGNRPARVVSRLVSPGSSVPGPGPQLPGSSGGPAPSHVTKARKKVLVRPGERPDLALKLSVPTPRFDA